MCSEYSSASRSQSFLLKTKPIAGIFEESDFLMPCRWSRREFTASEFIFDVSPFFFGYGEIDFSRGVVMLAIVRAIFSASSFCMYCFSSFATKSSVPILAFVS